MKSPNHSLNYCLAVSALPILLTGCIIGGTGTDTENGVRKNDMVEPPAPGISARIVDSVGNPVAGITLTAVHSLFRPDSVNNSLQNFAVNNDASQKNVLSNTLGQVGFSLPTSGTYIVEGSKAGQKLFFDTLKLADANTPQTITFRIRSRQAFKGKVKLASGMRIDSGKVFIRGTSLVVKVDTTGFYDLGSLPFDINKMAIGLRFSASPTKVLEISQSLVARVPVVDTLVPALPGQLGLKVVYNCAELSKDSSAKLFNRSVPTIIDTGSAVGEMLLRDSVRIKTALMSCDSIPSGTVVNLQPLVVSPSILGASLISVKDSVNGSILIPTQQDALKSNSAGQVVPYIHCLGTLGVEKTTLEVKLEESILGTDLLTNDLDRTCVIP